MPLNQFIINDLNPASPETLVEELQTVFKQLTYSHIPVLKEQVYLGCLSETDVYCFEPQQAVSEVLYAIEGFFVRVPLCGSMFWRHLHKTTVTSCLYWMLKIIISAIIN